MIPVVQEPTGTFKAPKALKANNPKAKARQKIHNTQTVYYHKASKQTLTKPNKSSVVADRKIKPSTSCRALLTTNMDHRPKNISP